MEFVQIDPDDGPDGRRPEEVWLSPATAAPAQAQSATSKARRPGGAVGSVLMAAMLGLAEALGWERPSEETVQIADAPMGDDGLKLNYRHLEPLDP